MIVDMCVKNRQSVTEDNPKKRKGKVLEYYLAMVQRPLGNSLYTSGPKK